MQNLPTHKHKQMVVFICNIMQEVNGQITIPLILGLCGNGTVMVVDWMFNLLIGDSSGARVPLKIPLKAEYADINVGDDVELVVTSDDAYFYTFQAVREAYFPFLNIWAGEYPFLDRRGMVAVSDRIASVRNKADARASGARREG